MTYDQRIANELDVRPQQIAATIALFDEGGSWYGNTIAINQGHQQFTPLYDEDCWMNWNGLHCESGRYYCDGASLEAIVNGTEVLPCGG